MVVEGIGEGKGVGGDKGSHRKEYIGTKRKKKKRKEQGKGWDERSSSKTADNGKAKDMVCSVKKYDACVHTVW